MSARKTLLHYLFSKEGAPLYREGNGTLEEDKKKYLKPDGQLAHLENDPDGWRDMLVKYARNTKYGGLFRDFTVPIRFVKSAAQILIDKMWSIGMEAIVFYGIMKLDRTSLPYSYTPWYLGELNFSKIQQTKTEVTIECLQGGLSKYLKAYEGTVYEIDIESDDSYKTALIDGMELENSASFAINSGVSTDLNANYGNHLVQMDLIQKEIEDIGGVAPVTRTKVNNFNPDIRATGKWFFIATTTGVIKIKYNYTLTTTYFAPPAINPAANLIHLIRKIDKTGFGTSTNLLTGPTPTGAAIPGTRTISGEKEIQVIAGDELYLFTGLNVTGSTGDAQTTFEYGGDEPLFEISYTYREPVTVAKGLSPKRLAERIVERMTEAEPGRYGVVSKFLDSLEDTIVMVSGDSLRRIESPKIKTSMAEFFKSFNRWGIHLDISGNNIQIEKHAAFYQNEILMDLGDVVGAKISVAEDIVFNTISNGYKAQDYQEINGRYEFNQGQKWTTPNTKIIRDLDLVSVYRADPFGAELMRINFGQKKTTDSDSDNDTWFINVKKNFTNIQATMSFVTLFPPLNIPFIVVVGAPNTVNQIKKGTKFKVIGTVYNDNYFSAAADAVMSADPNIYLIALDSATLTNEDNVFATIQTQEYILNRPAYSSVEGLLHPATAFNIELSPVRSILENGAWIRSVLDLQDEQFVKFSSADKNTDLVTTLAGVTISERTDIKIGSLAARLFKPYYFTFRTQLPITAYELLNANPYKKIKFWHEGEPFTGYLTDGGIKPDVIETQEWKLLCSPENNLKKFKTY